MTIHKKPNKLYFTENNDPRKSLSEHQVDLLRWIHGCYVLIREDPHQDSASKLPVAQTLIDT